MAIEVNSVIPSEWRPSERYIAKCARCGSEILKKNSVALYRQRKGCTMSILLYFCQQCYVNFLDDYGISE